PLYIEPVYGTRSWNVTPEGMLQGVVHQQVWQPGVNLAECRKGEHDAGFIVTPEGRLYSFTAASRWSPQPIRRAGHRMSACECGFYMYREGSADFTSPHYSRRNPSRVVGVVKGWGLWVEASHGSRVERAQIVALHIPREPLPLVWRSVLSSARRDPISDELAERVHANYPEAVFFDSLEAMLRGFRTSHLYEHPEAS